MPGYFIPSGALLEALSSFASRIALWPGFLPPLWLILLYLFTGSSSFPHTLTMECVRSSLWFGSGFFFFFLPTLTSKWSHTFSPHLLSHLIHSHGFKCHLNANDSQMHNSGAFHGLQAQYLVADWMSNRVLKLNFFGHAARHTGS